MPSGPEGLWDGVLAATVLAAPIIGLHCAGKRELQGKQVVSDST